jgi:phosphatidylglycerol:prolipoprotein diacylglycerol transferase
MFYHTINPVLLKLGFLQIRYYGFAYIIGFVLAYFYLKHAAKHGLVKNLTEKLVEDLTLWIGIAVIMGARVFDFIFYNPSVFWTDPLELFKVWHGGMSFHGGLIGVAIAAYFFSKKHKLNLLELGDVLVFPAALGLAIGRIANFINGELYGIKTSVSWCIDYSKNTFIQNVPEGCRHPYQIYASLSHFAIFGLLYFHKRWKRYNGQFVWLFIYYYGLFRFLLDFYREDPRWLGISMGQFLSLAMFALGLVMLIRNRKRK